MADYIEQISIAANEISFLPNDLTAVKALQAKKKMAGLIIKLMNEDG